MVYCTGDIHGAIYERFNPQMMPGEDQWDENDVLLVAGDFGAVFYPKMDLFLDKIALEKQKIEFLEKKRYSICFCDGNHENFDRLTSEFPMEERFGGTVRRIARNVFWLQRSQCYSINGKSFFVLGGAYSIDKGSRLAQDRFILSHYENCSAQHLSWWPQELPSEEEYRLAEMNLQACDWTVDYVLTHTCPTELIRLMGYVPDPHEAPLTAFLDRIWSTAIFSNWLYGHYHLDRAVHPKATALYSKLAVLDTSAPRIIN